MDQSLKARLVAALEPIRIRVRNDAVWVKRQGEPPLRIEGELNDERMGRHVNGGPVYGAAPIAPGTSVTMVAVLDLDSHKGESNWEQMRAAAREVCTAARLADLEPIPFRSSGGKGIHVLFMWEHPQDAYSVRQTLRAVLAACGFHDGTAGVAKKQVEVFPKQDQVAEGRYGNMFILPGGGQSVPLLGETLELGTKEDIDLLYGGDRFPRSYPVLVMERPPRPERPAPVVVGGDGLGRVAAALAAIPNTAENGFDYETARNIVFAVHAATGGSPEGHELAASWYLDWPDATLEWFDDKLWNYCDARGEADNLVPPDYLFAKARATGWPDPYIIEAFPDLEAEARDARERQRATAIGEHGSIEPVTPTVDRLTVEQMREQLVLIEDGSRVARRDAPHLVLPIAEYKRRTQAAFTWRTNANGRQVKEYHIDLWLESVTRLSVHTQTFAPGQPEFCWSPEGAPAQNLWLPRSERMFSPPAPPDWATRAKVFFDHIAYLVPDETERSRFLDWLAHIEQEPGVLPQTHYLLVARQTGIGRNWLSYVLARVWAGYVALGFDLADSLRNGFNGSLSRKVLACVDELHEAGTGPEAARTGEKLKSMLTEKTRLINPKYGRQHTEYNCCRFLMFSNHDAALPLAENDRRVIVIENPTERRDAEYYDRVYALIDDSAFIGSVIKALQARDISDFNPGAVAPMNTAKQAVINAGRNELVQAIADIARDWPSDCIAATDLKAQMGTITGASLERTAKIAGYAQQAGLRPYPTVVKVGDERIRVWILRNQASWAGALPSAIADEVLRGRPESTGVEGDLL